MLLTLSLISVLSAAALTYVHEVTKEPIRRAKKEKMLKALRKVLPEFDNDLLKDQIKAASEIDTIKIFPAYKDEHWKGAAVTGLSDKGYGGLIRIMVGFNADKTIRNIAVLEHKETPGLGTKMKDTVFINKFVGKNPDNMNLKVTKDGGEIDALSGATITTRAFLEALENASHFFETNINKMKKE